MTDIEKFELKLWKGMSWFLIVVLAITMFFGDFK